jgi:hypothetical protein
MGCHTDHDHDHGKGCGHTAVKHGDHVDFLHDGHLHHPAGTDVEEHALDVNGANPNACTPAHDCGGHAKDHVHGPECGHEAVRTAITSIISWTATYIIRTETTATTMARLRS